MIKMYFLLIVGLLSLSQIVKSQKEGNEMNKLYKYKILEAGKIQPEGWIKEQLSKDLTDGYIGHYDDVHHTVNYNVFFNQNRISKRKYSLRKEWWSGEHEGYWQDAKIRMAFLAQNKKYIQEAKDWMEELLKHIDESGYIGIYADCDDFGCRFHHKRGNGELWATSRMLMATLAYYEFTGDKRFLDASEKAARLVMDNYSDENYFEVNSRGGGVSHGVGFFENLEWLYRITGDNDYLEFAVKLYEDFNNGNVRDDDLKTQQLLNEKELFDKHGAHIAEGFFIPEFIATLVDEKRYDSAANNALEKLYQHLTPSGAMRCDEWIKGRKGTADERYEYCGIAEMVSPLSKMITFTGNIQLADRIEKMTFNAGQGARFPVLKAVSYLTADNRIKIKHREIAKRESYDAAHFAAACCALNAGRLMPYYTEGMWMKDEEKNQVLAMLYGPSVLNTQLGDTQIEIEEKTDYPFEDQIKFVLKPEKPKTFSLVLRKPFNCQDIKWDIPENAKLEEFNDRLVISHKWQKGDEVQVKFNFKIQQVEQPESKTVKDSGVYIQRGPLVYALPFEHRIKEVKEHRNSGFYRYKVKAIDKSNWKLKLNTKEKLEFIPADKQNITEPWEWNKPVVKIKATLQDEKNESKKYELVPIGNTIFRRVTFSVYK